jgi:HEAT repeat protein
MAAAQALARIGTADAVPALLAWGSNDAKEALGLINAKGVDEMLEKAAKSGNGAERATAIEALALRGCVQLIDSFFAYAADSDQQVAKAGVQAIHMLGRDEDLKNAVALLLANEKTPLSRDVLKTIVAILRRSTQQNEAVAVMVGGMFGASPKGQAMILQALAQVGSDAALAPVAKASRSKDAVLQKEAVKLLGNWPDENALPVLLEIAGDTSAPLADHVLAIRGIARLFAGQKNLDRETASLALALCRRDEERQQISDLLEASQDNDKQGKKKKKKN